MEDAQVGAVLQAVRIRSGRSQREVAVAAGIGRSTVSLLERGHLRGASVGAIRDVASVLGMSVALAPRWRGAELSSCSTLAMPRSSAR
jgi:transcriptional regulator with XRE-family HTH domain